MPRFETLINSAGVLVAASLAGAQDLKQDVAAQGIRGEKGKATPSVAAHGPHAAPGIRGGDKVATPLVILHAAHAAQGIRSEKEKIAPSVAAREAPQAMHLAYLQCYPLSETAKKACQDKISPLVLKKLSPQSRKTFIYEAERLGFVAFLRQHGKACLRLDEGPRFDKKHKAYVIHCIKGASLPPSTHLMRFDSKTGLWSLLDVSPNSASPDSEAP